MARFELLQDKLEVAQMMEFVFGGKKTSLEKEKILLTSIFSF